eukprot:gene24143-32560_t
MASLSVGDIARTKIIEELYSSAVIFHGLEVNSRFKNIDEVADRYCTVVDVDDEEGIISVMLDDGYEAQLPFNAFIGVIIEESLHSKYEAGENEDVALDHEVKIFAAQCIQTAFRRYLDCKSAIRIRKINSTQRLVQDMAVATIISGWRRSKERKRKRIFSEKAKHKSRNSSNLSKHTPSVVISDLKTLNLPRDLLGHSDLLTAEFMIMNKFSKTPTGIAPPPYWRSEITGKVVNKTDVHWSASYLVAPVILEELEVNPKYQLILRANLNYNGQKTMGFCECNLLAVYDELAVKYSSKCAPNHAKKAISRLLVVDDLVFTNTGESKPVISFCISLESPPPSSYRCGNYQYDVQKGIGSGKVFGNSVVSASESINLQSVSTVDYPTKDKDIPSHAPKVSSITSVSVDNTKQPNLINADVHQLAEKPPRVKNTTKFEKLKHNRSEPEAEKKVKPHGSEKVALNSTSSVVKRSLFDEIFSLVIRKYAAVITVGVKELCIILDALDVPVRDDILHSNPTFRIDLASSTPTFHQIDHVQLPLSDAASLAATLSLETVQRNILSDAGAVGGNTRRKGDKSIITEKQAEIARNELLKLIRGNFDKCKEFILRACADTQSLSSGRPSEWTAKQVMQFISTLSLESRKFSPLSGSELLKIRLEESALREYEIHQPILQKRFAIYRQTLLYIDKWWDYGLRPSNLFSSAELKQIAMNNFERKGKRDVFSESVRKVSNANATEINGTIKIAEFDELLREITRFNRAYGWGLSPGLLTNVCVQIAGRNACVIQLENRGEDSSNGHNSTINSGRSNSEISSDLKYSSDSGSHPPLQYFAYTGPHQPLTVVKGCKWVRIALNPSEVNHSLESSFIWRPDKSYFEQDLSSKGGLLDRAQEVCDCFALIPSICCRKPSGNEKHLLEVMDDLNNNSNNNANSLLIAAKVQVGMVASIVDYSTLIRLYQRFDWWDQPSYEFLRAVAGSHVQVVSVAGLNGSLRGRIGVQCLESDHCDAVPVEAITSLVPREEFTEPAMKAEKKITKKKLPSSTYGKKEKSSRSKRSSAPVSARTTRISASDSVDIDMKKCKLVEGASMLSNLSSVVEPPAMIQPSTPVVQILDRRDSHGPDRPLSRTSSSISAQHVASSSQKAHVLDTAYPEESPSNGLVMPDSPHNYAWLKLVSKNQIPDKDVELADAGEPKYVSRKRREFAYPTLNLAFEPSSPVQLPSRARKEKEKLQESTRNASGAKSKTPNNQFEDKIAGNEDFMEMEFVTFIKPSQSGKKMGSNNNDSNGSNLVRPKSAPSIPKQRTMANTPGVQGLNGVSGKLATDFNAELATEVDVVSNSTPPHRQQRTKRVNTLEETNKAEGRFVELRISTFDDSDVLRGGGGGGARTTNISRPSSAGTVRPRRPKSSLHAPSGHASPDPTIVEESLNGTNLKTKKQFTETENNPAGETENVKDRPRRSFTKNSSKVREWSQQEDQDREEALRKREMSLSEREAIFKESYLRRQLKRLGVGTGDT